MVLFSADIVIELSLLTCEGGGAINLDTADSYNHSYNELSYTSYSFIQHLLQLHLSKFIVCDLWQYLSFIHPLLIWFVSNHFELPILSSVLKVLDKCLCSRGYQPWLANRKPMFFVMPTTIDLTATPFPLLSWVEITTVEWIGKYRYMCWCA